MKESSSAKAEGRRMKEEENPPRGKTLLPSAFYLHP
jgi:hypothetical protein